MRFREREAGEIGAKGKWKTLFKCVWHSVWSISQFSNIYTAVQECGTRLLGGYMYGAPFFVGPFFLHRHLLVQLLVPFIMIITP